MSIEKSFLVFTFKLQHAFTRSAVFHVEWPVLMQTQSLGIQTGSSSGRGSQGKEWENEEGRGMEGETRRRGRGALIERLWLAVFSGTPGPPSCSNRVVASRGAVKEKSVLYKAPSISPPPLPSIPQLLSPPSHTFPAPPKKSIWLCKVQLGPGGVPASCRG